MISSEYVAVKPDGDALRLIIELYEPELDPKSDAGDYRGHINVLALGLDEYLYGVDALQAYCMVLKRLKLLFDDLIANGWRFYLPGYPDTEIDIISTHF